MLFLSLGLESVLRMRMQNGLDIFKGGNEGQLILKYTLNDLVSFSDVRLFAEPSIIRALHLNSCFLLYTPHSFKKSSLKIDVFPLQTSRKLCRRTNAQPNARPDG